MLACVDVDYRDNIASAACVVLAAWSDAAPAAKLVRATPIAAPYRPGELWRRELPPIAAVLADVAAPLEVVIVDAYVWLAPGRPGFGARLHDALGGRVAVVGVAKTAWGGDASAAKGDARRAIAVTRGGSARPLFVTAVGIDVEDAANRVASMHGAHRLPTMIQLADHLARGRVAVTGGR